jgi:hypothetical protein
MAGRVFDHLDGAPEDQDRHFSKAAHRMRRAKTWSVAPARHPNEGGRVERTAWGLTTRDMFTDGEIAAGEVTAR